MAQSKKPKSVAGRKPRSKKLSPENVAREIVEKENKRIRKSDSRVPQTEPGENSKYLMHSIKLAKMPKVNVADEKEVEDRIFEYFDVCIQDDMKPSVSGMALALGIDRTYLWKIRAGEKGKNPETVNVIKKAMALLENQMNDYMQNGKINPASGIFLMKNHFGYRDEQKVTVEAQSPLGDTQSPEQLEKRYLESVPTVNADFAETDNKPETKKK